MSGPNARRLVLVVGVGRSGTSLLTGILGQLGMHIPTPEVTADDTNPRGFGEPRWVVDFHSRLLRKRRVTVNDARPAAFELMTEGPAIAAAYDELRAWLAPQFEHAETVVIKDPRTVWFLPMWTRCAEELHIPTSFVTMLRHPAEILTSARKSYGDWQTEASRAAAWLNVILETEHSTRDAPRAFVRYEDLLREWRGQIARAGARLGVPALRDIRPGDFTQVDEFVDPTLYRTRVGWTDVDVPARVRVLAEQVWQQLQPLATASDESPEALAALDESRAAYLELYGEAEAIAQSSIHAAKPRARKAAPAPPTLRARIARRVPAPVRQRIRSALRGQPKGGAAERRS